MQAQARSSDDFRRGSLIPAASAAQALAQLQFHRAPDSDWGGDNMSQVIVPALQASPTNTEADFLQNFYSDGNHDLKNHGFHVDPSLDEAAFMHDSNTYPSSAAQDQPNLLQTSMHRSPTDRLTHPPIQRSLSARHARPRKSSLSQQARLAKHERRKSKDLAKRNSGEKKAFFSDSNAAIHYGKRWEDLLDAATSATEEEDSRDLTPIPASPYQSPRATARTSLPPFALGSQFQSYQASPLNRAATPPPADGDLELPPFEEVESSLSNHQHNNSADSGAQFQIMNPASMDSSPLFSTATANSQHHVGAPPVQLYLCRV
ncbi:hypothetical protein MRB53_040191 [Persea americana]|nr:hypothetical protein MRB53_040191 [Persea americana]